MPSKSSFYISKVTIFSNDKYVCSHLVVDRVLTCGTYRWHC